MTSTFTPSGPARDSITPEALRSAIAVADPGALLMSMVHVSGDLTLLDEFEEQVAQAKSAQAGGGTATQTHYGAQSGAVATPPGQFPADVAAAIRERQRRCSRPNCLCNWTCPNPSCSAGWPRCAPSAQWTTNSCRFCSSRQGSKRHNGEFR